MREKFHDLRLPLTLCFGTRHMPLGEVLELTQGDVFSLERTLDEPVRILAGGKEIAKAEVVAVDGNYAVRILSTTASETLQTSANE
ncbi:FliM/FliN family flagellar motor C-terminal domain-containing protein [Terriglobus albidus]|uniref:FliM/FliN family flagellar motor C-terminal domain-containing protein n=1 Tax=Terriglobus albidus TaxID=1592106 RepID=UPI0021E0209B|nr:FliM/FliN family flagellar motor C-terminal domain-containing protein [Terriglobus albidus]